MISNNKPNKRLFVGSLPYKFTEGELLSLFITEGKIISVRIIHNKWGRSRGIGYIEYENEADAIKAKQKYHNYPIGDRTIIVDYAKPDPFLTPEGKIKHEEALKRKGKKNKFTTDLGIQPRGSDKISSFPKKSDNKRIRQTVFDTRHFGARTGAKFAKKTKLKQKRNKK